MKEENKRAKKIADQFKDFKAKEMQKPVILNNHIDQKHYYNNFEGTFGRIFEKIFGT